MPPGLHTFKLLSFNELTTTCPKFKVLPVKVGVNVGASPVTSIVNVVFGELVYVTTTEPVDAYAIGMMNLLNNFIIAVCCSLLIVTIDRPWTIELSAYGTSTGGKGAAGP